MVWFWAMLPTFRRYMIPHTNFGHDDGGGMYLRNVGNIPLIHLVQQSKVRINIDRSGEYSYCVVPGYDAM
jgi:hypothetical protein